MKQSINPAVATVVIVIVVAVVGFFLWKGANGGAGSVPLGLVNGHRHRRTRGCDECVALRRRSRGGRISRCDRAVRPGAGHPRGTIAPR